ncbi:MAG: hypothetical protein IPH43_14975 [Xanthomonadales bacterium]|nr:hypothetical protein [Xanthomonadales bacterium]
MHWFKPYTRCRLGVPAWVTLIDPEPLGPAAFCVPSQLATPAVVAGHRLSSTSKLPLSTSGNTLVRS